MAADRPTWREGDECFSCERRFNFIHRKHHCRNCGGLFCGPCSRRRSPIPSLGYDSPVRVCEVCFQLVDAMVPKRSAAASGQFTTAPPSPPRSTVSSIAEDDTASDEAAVGKARSGSQRANPPPPPVTDAIRRATVSGMPRSSQPGPVHAKTLTAAQARQAQAQKRHSVMPKPPPPPPRRPGGKRRNQSTFVRRAKPQRPSVPPPEHLLAQRKLPKPEPKPEEGTKET